MTDQSIYDKAAKKKQEAQERLVGFSQAIVDLQAKAADCQHEIESWDFFLSQLASLSRGGSRKSNGESPKKPRVKKGTIPAFIAGMLATAIDSNGELKASEIADRLKTDGRVTSDNYRNIVYTTLSRRSDLFEKSSPGLFRLVTDDYEVVDGNEE